jgi:hypothetical protein
LRAVQALEQMLLEEMAPEDDFVRTVVGLVRAGKPTDVAPRPERGCVCHPSWLVLPPEFSAKCQKAKVCPPCPPKAVAVQ